ncbi:MAG: CaiB/BaiF CoA transferase family protein [Myxococcota bacterium]
MPSRTRDAHVPLAGVRVIDLSHVLTGPYATRILAELGADVIKIESPQGDMSRLIAAKKDRGQSGLYTYANLGKRNVCIDLRKPGGAELVLELVRTAHAVVENLRPGVADRLGIGWEHVHRARPRAVMLSISGYGAGSSLGDRGAFAPTMQAATGLLEYQARATGHPVARLADARADMTTALHGVIALLAALRIAERTGEGQHIELCMYDAVLASYSESPHELLEGSEVREEAPPFDAGPNGWIAVAGPPQHGWALMRKAFPELEDPTPTGADLETKARLRHEAMEAWMAKQPGVEALLEKLDRAGLPCARVAPLHEALTGPFARERELLLHVDDRRGGTRPVVRSPLRFSRSPCEPQRPAPLQGEHNAEVLRELLGLDDERIRALERSGVLRPTPR